MFIVFEGLDGTGKSSLAKALAEELRAIYVKTPPPEFEPVRKIIHSEQNPYTRFLFYFSSVMYISERVQNMSKETIVFCDRYFYTSLADFFAQSNPTKSEREFWIHIARSSCTIPDIVIFCQCNREVRLARIIDRNANMQLNARDDLSESFEHGMMEAFTSIFNENEVLRVDTSKRSVNQLVEFIMHTEPFVSLVGCNSTLTTKSISL